ncbi:MULTISPECIES: hypothetical protein [unclassified Nitrobacter]|uniref:hypothetical protein n=1 Tax=unclassified Nitrobacter TaxID=2620411 RepID=UPI00092927F8|nr:MULTISPECIES: hypothetical protein [unclassified Nitrobacter]MBN9149340.1 hypothetical protein [Nitrobacter sp.]OJV01572.1 MAG: hypothetical protein BGO16_17070 [Nitrobacter sp. 62-23]
MKPQSKAYVLRSIIALPVAIGLAFLLERPLSAFFQAVGINIENASFLMLSRKSYQFFAQRSLADQTSILDFYILEMFIWLALILCVVHVVATLTSTNSVNSYLEKLQEIRDQRRSQKKLFVVLLGGGLTGMIVAENFSLAYQADLARFAMETSPRVYIALSAILFCWSATFFSEGLLFLCYFFTLREAPRP